jgi:hypothetical protein
MSLRKSLINGFETELEDLEVRKSDSLINRVYSVGSGGSIHCIPLVKNGIVYFGSVDHYIYCIRL